MRNSINILVLMLCLVATKSYSQELPYGKYSLHNPKCIEFSSSSITIGKDFSLFFTPGSSISSSLREGKYERVENEYIFTFLPKNDTIFYVPSTHFDQNDISLTSDSIIIQVQDFYKDLVFGANVVLLDKKHEFIHGEVTDTEGCAKLSKSHFEKAALIEVSYTGLDTLEIKTDKIDGNKIVFKLGTLLGRSVGVEMLKIRVKKTKQGILIEWPYDLKYYEWFHESKWNDEDCY
ncbi:MAG: hypothetical protein H6563_01095 [Lewinellaceae bacterium]|nr:hypothetical protein [Lewinellaceae bacterium]